MARKKIEGIRPLTKKRMGTIDDDIVERAAGFVKKQQKAGKPLFAWVNTTHMHFRTHGKPGSCEQAGRGYNTFTGTIDYHFRHKHHFLLNATPNNNSRSVTLNRTVEFEGVGCWRVLPFASSENRGPFN